MHDYYRKNLRKSEKLYALLSKWVRPMLGEYFTDYQVDKVMNKTDVEGVKILHRLPYIGGSDNVFSPIIIMNGWFISFYRGMQSIGESALVTSYFNRRVSKKLFDKVPRKLGKYIGKVVFSKVSEKYFEKQARRTQAKVEAADFVYTFESVNDLENEFQMVFTECAVHKFYDLEKVPELKAYCNFADPLYSERFNMGCNAEKSLANGYETCTLNFKRDRPTETPSNIKLLIESVEESLSLKFKGDR